MTDAHHADPEPPLDVEVLIGRLIDGEAQDDDHRAFDALASADPSLWRRLAQRQLDGTQLTRAVADATDFAEAVPLPEHGAGARSGSGFGVGWPLALSGWAAMLLIGLTWIMVTSSRDPIRETTPANTPVVSMDPETHFEFYLEAPYVIGELPYLVTDVQVLHDGRRAVTVMRRIEEVILFDSDEQLPSIDDDGSLLEDARKLREPAPDSVN